MTIFTQYGSRILTLTQRTREFPAQPVGSDVLGVPVHPGGVLTGGDLFGSVEARVQF